MVYDCFQFFDELDILEIRLNTLYPVVDYFVLVESTVTFSGNPKPLYFNENKDRFEEFKDKIIHVVVSDSPSGVGVTPFDVDVFQKESRARSLVNCKIDDIIIYSDLDEIPNPVEISVLKDKFDPSKVYQFAQRQFYFYLNLEEQSGLLESYAGDFEGILKKKWLGPYAFSYGLLLERGMNALRLEKSHSKAVRIDDGGWHFSYMGGDGGESVEQRVAYKIKSAAHQEFNNKKILSGLSKKISKKKDIFGRKSKFTAVNIDSTFPPYVVKNVEKYQHLILGENKSIWKKLTDLIF